jgi:hypothetical protein
MLTVTGERFVVSDSRLQQFRQWLLGGRAYNDLTVGAAAAPDNAANEQQQRKVLLLDDLPFLFDDTQRAEFIDILKDYLGTAETRHPLVIVLTGPGETAARSLLPAEIRLSSLVTPIA